jgi:hypothetical protein
LLLNGRGFTLSALGIPSIKQLFPQTDNTHESNNTQNDKNIRMAFLDGRHERSPGVK